MILLAEPICCCLFKQYIKRFPTVIMCNRIKKSITLLIHVKSCLISVFCKYLSFKYCRCTRLYTHMRLQCPKDWSLDYIPPPTQLCVIVCKRWYICYSIRSMHICDAYDEKKQRVGVVVINLMTVSSPSLPYTCAACMSPLYMRCNISRIFWLTTKHGG